MAATYASFKTLMIALVAGQGSAAVAQDSSPDSRAWEAARASDTAEAYQQYLSEFPTGAYAEEAFRFVVEGIIPAGASGGRSTSIDIY
ncbi:MAG: hypothetical protein OEU92_28090 [Alphaproteobacteria bacterium]|nr:hypothetical protein [Alphaproteobacteria bacterium]